MGKLKAAFKARCGISARCEGRSAAAGWVGLSTVGRRVEETSLLPPGSPVRKFARRESRSKNMLPRLRPRRRLKKQYRRSRTAFDVYVQNNGPDMADERHRWVGSGIKEVERAFGGIGGGGMIWGKTLQDSGWSIGSYVRRKSCSRNQGRGRKGLA